MISITRHDARPVSLREASELLNVFAHPIRLQLLEALRVDAQGVTALVARTGLEQPVVSRHLALLRRAGVVRVEPSGRERIYSVADRRAVPLMDVLFGERKEAS